MGGLCVNFFFSIHTARMRPSWQHHKHGERSGIQRDQSAGPANHPSIVSAKQSTTASGSISLRSQRSWNPNLSYISMLNARSRRRKFGCAAAAAASATSSCRRPLGPGCRRIDGKILTTAADEERHGRLMRGNDWGV